MTDKNIQEEVRINIKNQLSKNSLLDDAERFLIEKWCDEAILLTLAEVEKIIDNWFQEHKHTKYFKSKGEKEEKIEHYECFPFEFKELKQKLKEMKGK